MNSTNSSVPYIAVCYVLSDAHPSILQFPSRLAFFNHVIVCAINVLLTVTTVITNSCIVVTFLRSPRLRKNVSLFLIMLLSCVDIGVGLISNSIFVAELASEIAGTVDCWLHLVRTRSSVVLTNLSLLTVSGINVERYYGVVHPFIHRKNLTQRKLMNFIMLSWSTCGMMLGVSFFSCRAFLIYSAVVKMAFVAFTLFVYASIALSVLLNQKNRRGLTSSQQNDSMQCSNAQSQSSCEKRKDKRRFLKELKLTKSCLCIVLCYVVCYIPVSVFLGAIPDRLRGYDYILALTWCTTLAMLNSTFNSVIFFWRSRHLRKEMRHAFKWNSRRTEEWNINGIDWILGLFKNLVHDEKWSMHNEFEEKPSMMNVDLLRELGHIISIFYGAVL